MKDSLTVTENSDGTFTVEWDSNDPKYSFMNNLTQQQIQDIVTKNLEYYIKENNGL
jgi:hypothetical protein